MPVSHIGLTVTHLPTSCSFFLAALQPLGYRYIGQQGNQIGLGIEEADFFLCGETAGIKAGAAHIAFSAPDRCAVRDFYTAALTAGGRPHGAPSCRNEETGSFNAAVLDFDGNSIEVVYREDKDNTALTNREPSRVLTWRQDVASSIGETQSVITQSSVRPVLKRAVTTVATTVSAGTVDDSSRSVPSPPPADPPKDLKRSNSDDFGAKRLIGTLLGAAAGAAVAYVMCKGEQEGARDEAMAYAASQASSQKGTHKQKLLEHDLPGRDSSRRNVSVTESIYESHQHRRVATRAIEAPPPPRSYHSPTFHTVAPTAYSQSNFTYRYVDAPVRENHAVYSPSRSGSLSGSSASKPRHHSVAPTLISSFVPSEALRALAAPEQDAVSVSSHRSHKSRRSSTKEDDKAPSKAPSRAPSKTHTVDPPKEAASHAPSKAPSPPAEPVFDPNKPLYAPASRMTTVQPTAKTQTAPTTPPTKAPSKAPTKAPSAAPTKAPTSAPSKAPTKTPSNAPITPPSAAPSKGASKNPSVAPSKVPLPPSEFHRSHVEPPSPPRETPHHEVHVVRASPPTPPPEEHLQDAEPLELSDLDIDDATVLPSDSISQVGSSPTRSSHRRRRSPGAKSGHSHHTSRSRRSEHGDSKSHHSGHRSKHSHHSSRHSHAHRSHHSEKIEEQPEPEDIELPKSAAPSKAPSTHSKHEHNSSRRRSVIDTENAITIISRRSSKSHAKKTGESSDAGSESTVKPAKFKETYKASRKSSVVSEAKSLPWKGEEKRGARSMATAAI